MDDATLGHRAQLGDAGAIAQLLRHTEPDLRRFASRVCRSAADADDAVQHALVTLTVGLSSFRGASRLSTWIFTVIRNECRKYERRARRWIFGEYEGASSLATPEQRVEQQELLERLVGAIRELPPDLRAVFVLRELEESSVQECAARLAITEANVKVRLHRARALLRGALDTASGQ